MGKRIVWILLSGMFFLQPIFSDGITDSYAFLKDIPLFIQFVDATRNSGDFQKANQLRTSLLALPDKTLDKYEQAALEIRLDTMLSRMSLDLSPKQPSFAKELLQEALGKTPLLNKDSLFSYCAYADIYSIQYLIDSNLSKGIASAKEIGKAYKEYPNETTVLLLKANSLLYTPSFSKNSVKKALSMFLELLNQTNILLAPWDQASLYSGLGIACYKLDDYENAKGYLTAAKAMYGFDSTIDEYLQKLETHI
ncbi:hypothetical protein [uncultured Sphaerochaeta sp.]|uniref:hypothetical protein n=1 Tax=uncultured Sphaerochaeta sp. TaxID=886478 RepID=UPI002A0A0EA0|nr:hypothetical protein [uncultured Sphaerochaeta sp.]